MIRPFTLITMLLAALSGAYLFAVKHRAQVLDDQLAAIAQKSRIDAQRIQVLQAQWALEIDPTTLAGLAARFTNLQPMKNSQMVTLAALQAVLPPAGSAPPGGAPLAADMDIATNATAQNPGLPLPPPLPPASATMLVASIGAAPRPAVHRVHSISHLGIAQFAEALPPPKPYQPALPPQAPPQQLAVPMGAQLVSVKASAAPPPGYDAPPDDGGSSLGMAEDVAPPQPLVSNGAGN